MNSATGSKWFRIRVANTNLGEGNEKYANYFDEEIMERTDAFLRQLGFTP